MPIYEYICKTCGERFEIKQKFSDPPITSCADFSCSKGEPVEKIISAPAIMFKGTGWYVTDYSDKFKDPKKGTADGKSGQDKAESSSGEGSEKKADTASSGTSDSSTSSSSSSSSGSSSNSSSSSSSSSTSSSSGDG